MLFSFIIPHKNCVELLKRCLDSIPKRDDLEIIIVDDNSNPQQVDFENFPGLNIKNTKVILTKEGKGAGYARNVGMKYASGKWLLFADADDYYTNKINELLNYIKCCDADIVYFDAMSENQRTKIINKAMEDYIHGDMSSIRTIMFNCWTPWNKAFLHTYVNSRNLQWDEIPCGNDAKFVLLAGFYAKKTDIFNFKCYMHTIQKTGITYHKKTFEEEYIGLPTGMNIVNFLRFVNMPWIPFLRAIIGPKRFVRFISYYGITNTMKYYEKAISLFFKNKTFKELNTNEYKK